MKLYRNFKPLNILLELLNKRLKIKKKYILRSRNLKMTIRQTPYGKHFDILVNIL